jgi:hypothetical protein
MAVIGLGMGAAFATIYDIAVGDIDPAEAGSASGSLSSVQQLANAIGPAIITTIYFGALRGGQAHAMAVSLGAVISIGGAERDGRSVAAAQGAGGSVTAAVMLSLGACPRNRCLPNISTAGTRTKPPGRRSPRS